MFNKKNKDNQNVNNDGFEDNKTVSIVDRGLKYNIQKVEKEKNSWKFFSFISIVISNPNDFKVSTIAFWKGFKSKFEFDSRSEKSKSSENLGRLCKIRKAVPP